MSWPWRRFEEFYEAGRKRVLIEGLEQRKEQMIAALWANSNYDPQKEGEESPRAKIIEEIERNHEKVVELLLQPQRGATPAGAVADDGPQPISPENDPYGFFAAGKRGEEKLYAKLDKIKNPDRTVQEVIDTETTEKLDQIP